MEERRKKRVRVVSVNEGAGLAGSVAETVCVCMWVSLFLSPLAPCVLERSPQAVAG